MDYISVWLALEDVHKYNKGYIVARYSEPKPGHRVQLHVPLKHVYKYADWGKKGGIDIEIVNPSKVFEGINNRELGKDTKDCLEWLHGCFKAILEGKPVKNLDEVMVHAERIIERWNNEESESNA
ncbi:hypothetical protein Goe26_00070 [Bacillus phage vB_BsuM-Goe26]|nr:hypothetical protein Goe26_00070 [Bacillus phage vB_BsuM-Goe26]